MADQASHAARRRGRSGRRPLAIALAVCAVSLACGALAGVAGAATLVTLSGLAPESAAPGALITVNGSGFRSAPVVTARLGGEAAVTTVLSDNELTFTVPANAPAGATGVSVLVGGTASPGTLTFTVLAPLAITTTELPPSEVGLSYSARLGASGGAPALSWTTPASALPSGLSLSSNGVLSGTAKATFDGSLPVTVTDSDGVSATSDLPLEIGSGPTILTTSLPAATVGSAYAVSLQANGGTPPYNWSIPTGPIAGGLVLSSAGLLSGRAALPGKTTMGIRLTDALGDSVTENLALTERVPVVSVEVALAAADGEVEMLSPAGSTLPAAGPSPALDEPGAVDVVGVAAAPKGGGVWTVDSDGAVRAVGGAPVLGSLPAARARRSVVAITADPLGTGYWLATSSGAVYGFGSAHRYGAPPGGAVRGRIVAMAATPTGRGYWLVSSLGHVFAFGDAKRYGSSRRLRGTVGIAAAPGSGGYWVATGGGTVLGYGPARRLRLSGSPPQDGDVVGIAAAAQGTGYWLVSGTGGLYGFGSAASFSAAPTGGPRVTAVAATLTSH